MASNWSMNWARSGASADAGRNRREYERFTLPAAYSPVSVRLGPETVFAREGHAYNISEGGVMLELDDPIEPGAEVAVQITLPGFFEDGGPGRAVFALGRVVWVHAEDVEDGGAVRLAIAFTLFARRGDRERLRRNLASGRYARAA